MSDHSRVDRQFLDNLKARVSLLDLVATRVVLKQKGTKWWGCCPFHEENTPSFAVFGSFDNYYCFGCKAYGDVFAFVQYCESCSFMDAVRRLAATAGIAMPLPIEENRRSLDLLDALASWWHTILLADPQGRLARSYLRSRSVDGETLRD